MEKSSMNLQESHSAYRHLPRTYAACGETEFSVRMAEWVLVRISENRPAESQFHVLDLACGVGAAAEIFALNGYQVTGIDSSEEMLMEARRRTGSSLVEWIKQDMRQLNVAGHADFVTCMYDALNFMTTVDDLSAVFGRVATVLRCGGLFIFDMYTIRGLAETWGSRCEIHTDRADFFVVSQTEWNSEASINTKTLHGFERDGACWRRWIERHVIRAYPMEVIWAALEKNNFHVLDVSEWTGAEARPLRPETTRLLFTSKRL
jgi:SAM-dependent methyltransferase